MCDIGGLATPNVFALYFSVCLKNTGWRLKTMAKLDKQSYDGIVLVKHYVVCQEELIIYYVRIHQAPHTHMLLFQCCPPASWVLSRTGPSFCPYLPSFSTLFTSITFLSSSSSCPSLFILRLLQYFLHLCVHSNQLLYKPVVKKLTDCLILGWPLKCSCYPKLLYTYITTTLVHGGCLGDPVPSTMVFYSIWKAVSHLTPFRLTWSHLNPL